MSGKSNLVNLDAMIKRADFGVEDDSETSSFENFSGISIRDFINSGIVGPQLRKPDFQRETNHWDPFQIISLLECFINGDLVPSVILWKSPSYIFVIDGGHRLSALKAWVEDDYGDGANSQKLFGHDIPAEQKKSAALTRKLVQEKIGLWAEYHSKIGNDDLPADEKKKINTITTRALNVQWVNGNAEKAESSFFNINMKGTPLDDIEELLLKNRKKPVAIAARAIIRAGKGHRYWSNFEKDFSNKIESQAKDLHSLLFDPEVKKPIKTLDLPLGGSKGVRTALNVLIQFILVANRNQEKILRVSDYSDDETGKATLDVLKKTNNLAQRVTGNQNGSLGLHPAVYFYGPTGHHSSPMFLGTISLISEKMVYNKSASFFSIFSKVRYKLEDVLINFKSQIAVIIQKHMHQNRVTKYHELLDAIITELQNNTVITEEKLIDLAGFKGKIMTGTAKAKSSKFSIDTKSKVFIDSALKGAVKCSLCNGYLDTEKSVSYDHISRIQDGGLGEDENCQLTHPFCNQSLKN